MSSSAGAAAGATGKAGGGSSSGIRYANLSAYQRRCQRINASGAWAHVIYKPNQNMTRGDSSTVSAAATVDIKLPAAQVLPGSGSASSPGVIVSCIVQAQLSGSSWDFNISNTGWVSASFYTADTVRWTWYVGPKVGGAHTLVLRVKPFVRIGARGSTVSTASAAGSDVDTFPITAHVSVPWTEVPASVMSALAANFKVAQGLVESLTALIAALIALATTIGIKKRRRRTAPPPAPANPDDDAEAESDGARASSASSAR